MNHQDIVPEAIEVITKYNIMSKFPSYTFDSLDKEPYENIQFMLLCMNYEGKAHEMAGKKAEFYGDIER